MTSSRKFLTSAGVVGAGALAAPAIVKAQSPIKWRLQTYSGAPLGAHVILPQIEAFNKAANGLLEDPDLFRKVHVHQDTSSKSRSRHFRAALRP